MQCALSAVVGILNVAAPALLVVAPATTDGRRNITSTGALTQPANGNDTAYPSQIAPYRTTGIKKPT